MDSKTIKKPCFTLFIPAYHDEKNISTVVEKAIKLFNDYARDYVILIINDGSPDRTGEVADELAKKYSKVKVIHHLQNLGYGRVYQEGFRHAIGESDFEWIATIDGDNQYDVNELVNIIPLLHRYDMIITFRYKRIYSAARILISYIYNSIIRLLFRSNFRDISCGLKLIRREVAQRINIESTSTFVGAEITMKAMLMGYCIGEVGIHTFPREFGVSTSAKFKSIVATTKDMIKIRNKLFSQ